MMTERKQKQQKKILEKDIYEELKYVAELLDVVLDDVKEVGDMETMIKIEDTLESKNECAWSREITKELNKKIENKTYLRFKERDE